MKWEYGEDGLSCFDGKGDERDIGLKWCAKIFLKTWQQDLLDVHVYIT